MLSDVETAADSWHTDTHRDRHTHTHTFDLIQDFSAWISQRREEPVFCPNKNGPADKNRTAPVISILLIKIIKEILQLELLKT